MLILVLVLWMKIPVESGIADSSGNVVKTKIQSMEMITEDGSVKVSFKQNSEENIVLPKGNYTIELMPEIKPIKSIKIYELKTNGTINLGIDDVPETGDNSEWIEVYAIDPTKLEFENATVTAVAKGNVLYKCREWDFDEQNCYGEWTELMDIIPGEEYTFTLTQEDPGFAEINITSAQHLNETYGLISSIYDEVRLSDNIWSEPVYENQYVRVEYESNLTNGSVIDVYARNPNSTNTWVEVYYVNATSPLLGLSKIFNSTGEWSYVLLDNLSAPANSFDFKIMNNQSNETGYLEFDFIHDQATSEFFDDFETSNFGTLWAQDAQNDWFRGNERSYSSGSYSAAVDGSATNAWLKRAANYNLSRYNSCALSARIYIESNWDSDEFICMDYSTNGGTGWNRDSGSPNQAGVQDLCVDGDVDAEDTWHYVSYNINGTQLTSSFTFRFRSSVSGLAEDGNVDYVNLTCYTNSAPTHTTPILNSTFGTNLTSENLTVYLQNVSDPDNDAVYNITDWRLNGTSIAVLNLPFDAENNSTKDFSSYAQAVSEQNSPAHSSTGGIVGGAYNFDANNDAVIVSDSASLDITDEITIEAWVNIDTYTNWDAITVKPWNASGDPWTLYAIALADNNNFHMSLTSGGSRTLCYSANNTAQTGIWIHVAGVWNGTSMQMYVNGTASGASVLFAGPIDANDEDLAIGEYQWSGTTYDFDGSIDNVRIYNRALSAEQIKANYNSGNPDYRTIVSQETALGDIWQAAVTPADGTDLGVTLLSNNLTVVEPNSAPTHTTPILNSTFGTNLTSENLTCYNQSTHDADNDTMKNIFNWHRNGSSIAVLNMPFEGGSTSTWTKDYSGYSNDGTVYNAVWNSTGGYDGFGAYEFDGNGDLINITGSTSLDFPAGFSLHLRFKLRANFDSSSPNTMVLIDKYSSAQQNFMIALIGTDYNKANPPDGSLGIKVEGPVSGNYDYFWTTQTSWNADTWYDLTFSYDYSNASNSKFYVDCVDMMAPGMEITGTPHLNFSADWHIGGYQGDTSQLPSPPYYFNGTIADVKFYNYEAPAAQLSAWCQNKNNLIVSQFTQTGEKWACCITPNDGYQDGTELCSNNLTIIEPSAPEGPGLEMMWMDPDKGDINREQNMIAETSDEGEDELSFIENIFGNIWSVFIKD